MSERSRIAATAIVYGAVVVTRNLRDFRRIPGVQRPVVYLRALGWSLLAGSVRPLATVFVAHVVSALLLSYLLPSGPVYEVRRIR